MWLLENFQLSKRLMLYFWWTSLIYDILRCFCEPTGKEMVQLKNQKEQPIEADTQMASKCKKEAQGLNKFKKWKLKL